MWQSFVSSIPMVADCATALAFVFGAYQLWDIRRQNAVDAHLSFVETEREIWLTALQNKEMAPRVVSASWGKTEGVTPSEELFVAILLDHFDHAFVRYKRGALSRAHWERLRTYFVEILSESPAKEVWHSVKRLYSDEFRKQFDACLTKRQNDE